MWELHKIRVLWFNFEKCKKLIRANYITKHVFKNLQGDKICGNSHKFCYDETFFHQTHVK
ncbi:hypothetical protein AYB32_04720 [Leptospira kirschneri]|nr:hypothetical protein AYB32_04720 [Leptospira kirschneri]